MASPPTVASLFSGMGGLELGLELYLGDIRPVVYVEREAFCAENLAHKMDAGILAPAPVWTDIATFDGRPFRGMVDILCGGPPCQPYSVAGQRKGDADERSWGSGGTGPIFHTLRIIDEMRPALVFLENVPTWVTGGWFRRVGEELSGMGYKVQDPLFLAAGDVGASHRRERVFIMAYDTDRGKQFKPRKTIKGGNGQENGIFGQNGCTVAVSKKFTERKSHKQTNPVTQKGYAWEGTSGGGGDMADTGKPGLPGRQGQRTDHEPECKAAERSGGLPLFPPGPGELERWAEILERFPELAPAVGNAAENGQFGDRQSGQETKGRETAGGFEVRGSIRNVGNTEIWSPWSAGNGCETPGTTQGQAPQPPIHRMADEFSNRVDRLRACGNGVVPLQAAVAFAILVGGVEQMMEWRR